MDRMLVVVFNNEVKAYEGKKALLQLDNEGRPQAHADADHKAKLQEKLNQFDARIQAHLQKAKDRREATERQAQAKAQVLKAKAEVAKAKAL